MSTTPVMLAACLCVGFVLRAGSRRADAADGGAVRTFTSRSSPLPPFPRASACVPPLDHFAFCNTSLPVATRALLLARMLTVEELVAQMVSGPGP